MCFDLLKTSSAKRTTVSLKDSRVARSSRKCLRALSPSMRAYSHTEDDSGQCCVASIVNTFLAWKLWFKVRTRVLSFTKAGGI